MLLQYKTTSCKASPSKFFPHFIWLKYKEAQKLNQTKPKNNPPQKQTKASFIT